MALAKEQIKLAFEQSEKEVEDLHQRTKEGLVTAKLAGKQVGRQAGSKIQTKKSLAARNIIQRHSKDFHGTLLSHDDSWQGVIFVFASSCCLVFGW